MRIAPNLIPRLNLDYSFQDMLFGLRSIKKDISRAESQYLKEIFGDKKIYFTNTGRTGLYAIFKSLNLHPHSNIGVQLYTCPVVLDAIVKAGHKPFFIEIESETYTVDINDLKEKIDEINALILVHTFGHPADMDAINKIADSVPIIEDCAHSLLAKYKGKLTGTIGDASFFSFNSGKYLSAGGGGMIVVNKENASQEDISKIIEKFDGHSIQEEIAHLIFTYTKSLLYHKPWYGLFSFTLGNLLDKYFDFQNKRGLDLKKIRKTDLSVIINQLIFFEEKVEKQRRNAFYLINKLKDFSINLPIEKDWAYSTFYLFPIVFASQEERDKLHKRLFKNGIDTMKFYLETLPLAREKFGYKNNCLNTERIMNTVLILPHYYTLSQGDLNYIAKVLGEICK